MKKVCLNNIYYLPDEIFNDIFECVSFGVDFINIMVTCRKFYNICKITTIPIKIKNNKINKIINLLLYLSENKKKKGDGSNNETWYLSDDEKQEYECTNCRFIQEIAMQCEGIQYGDGKCGGNGIFCIDCIKISKCCEVNLESYDQCQGCKESVDGTHVCKICKRIYCEENCRSCQDNVCYVCNESVNKSSKIL